MTKLHPEGVVLVAASCPCRVDGLALGQARDRASLAQDPVVRAGTTIRHEDITVRTHRKQSYGN